MTRRLLFAALGLLAVSAQAPATLSESESLMLQSTQLLGAQSQAPCRDAVNQYLKQRQFVTEYFEKTYPGQTIDWSVIPAMLKAKP